MIIFLDIDGVLSHDKCDMDGSKLHNSCDIKCVEVLNGLTDRLSAKIVISSSWRYLYTLVGFQAYLRLCGVIAEIIGFTPLDIHDAVRGDAILAWIRANNYEGDYVVIDDYVEFITPFIDPKKIIHIKHGWWVGGLRQIHIDKYFEGIIK
jgi:hypothetical protein